MPVFELNFLSIVAVAVINMVLGFVWYSPKIIGKRWLELIGRSDAKLQIEGKDVARAYFFMFLGALVTSFVLANVVFYRSAITIYDGVLSGFWTWLGFTAMTGLGSVFFEKKSEELYFINAGFYLLTFIVGGAILAVWR